MGLDFTALIVFMRWFFLITTLFLLQSMTYIVVRGLQWWFGNLSVKQKRWLTILLFTFSNVLLIFAMLHFSKLGFRLIATWQAVMWLFILAMLTTGFIHKILHKFFQKTYQNPHYQKFGVKSLLLGIFLAMIGLAWYNAYVPTVHHLTLTTNQKMTQPMKIAMVADLHLGVLVGNRQLEKLNNILQKEQPELLLIAGDVLDDDTHYYDKENMSQSMAKLVKTLPLGVYATLGNHDVYGQQQQITKALQKSGVQVLNDETTVVDGRIYLVGRLDDAIQNRKKTTTLVPKKPDKPVILIDHRPSEIDTNVQFPIDLQVSGHTHNGQIFPANFIVKYLNTVSYGHKRINNTDVLVTSGFGFWGVPLRLGSQSEVWIIDLKNP